jgi:uncharacterized protein
MNDRLRKAARAACEGRPPAHDWSHVLRVERVARRIAEAERARVDVVVTAAVLHELVNLPKHHPESHRSGDLCAEAALKLLGASPIAEDVASCIRDHAFSKGAAPRTPEAAILQDADRLDAIGAIGIARCFATSTEMMRPFYADDDPFCRVRAPDDKQWGIDHFYRKLLRIELHTKTAQELSRERFAMMRAFLAQLEREIT